MEQNLQEIREACIAANREGLLEQTGDNEWSLKREIRLADVLLAIDKVELPVHIDNKFHLFADGSFWWNTPDNSAQWNLLQDDLSKQSEATKQLIASLL